MRIYYIILMYYHNYKYNINKGEVKIENEV